MHKDHNILLHWFIFIIV